MTEIQIYTQPTQVRLLLTKPDGSPFEPTGTLSAWVRSGGTHQVTVEQVAPSEFKLVFPQLPAGWGQWELAMDNSGSRAIMLSGSVCVLETLSGGTISDDLTAVVDDGQAVQLAVSKGIKGDKGDKGDTGDITPELQELADSCEDNLRDSLVAAQNAQAASQAAGVHEAGSQWYSQTSAASATEAAGYADASEASALDSAASATAAGNSASQAATSATNAATSASQAAGAVSGLLGANNNWTGTNTFSAPVTFNSSSVLAPNMGHSDSGSVASLRTIAATVTPVDFSRYLTGSIGFLNNGSATVGGFFTSVYDTLITSSILRGSEPYPWENTSWEWYGTFQVWKDAGVPTAPQSQGICLGIVRDNYVQIESHRLKGPTFPHILLDWTATGELWVRRMNPGEYHDTCSWNQKLTDAMSLNTKKTVKVSVRCDPPNTIVTVDGVSVTLPFFLDRAGCCVYALKRAADPGSTSMAVTACNFLLK